MSRAASEVAERVADRDLTRLDDLGFSDLKKQVLMAAGITPEILGAYLSDSIGVLQDSMQANRTQYFTHKGEIVEQRTEVDHGIRLKAAAELAALVSSIGELKGTEASQTTGGGVQITLNVPFLQQLETQAKDVTPSQDS